MDLRSPHRRGLAAGGLGLLALALAVSTPALGSVYPPGPGGSCPDTLTIYQVQDPSATCHPASGDTVQGFAGIVTAVDQIAPYYTFYLQAAAGGPWSGVRVMTAQTDYGFTPGDSVVVELSMVTEYWAETTAFPLDGGNNGTQIVLQRLSGGNPLPPFQLGTTHDFTPGPLSQPPPSPWEGCLVEIPAQVRVVRTSATGGFNNMADQFIVVDADGCPSGSPAGTVCDSVIVDGGSFTAFPLPPVGTIFQGIRGVFGRNLGYRIRLRSPSDVDETTTRTSWGAIKSRYAR